MKELYEYWFLHLFAVFTNIVALCLNLNTHLAMSITLIIIPFVCLCILFYIFILEIKSFRFTLGSLLTLVGKKCRIAWLYKLGEKVK